VTQITEAEARQMIAVANTRNVDKILEQYADNATFQVPNLDAPIHGKAAIREFLSGSFVAFPDWTIDVTKVFVSGDETVVVNSVRGTHTGPLTGQDGKSIAPTNRKFVQDQMTRVVLNGHGKVESLRAYGNPAELYHQLGLKQ
jgi:ketosteroid isomerase-like protein